MPPEHASICHFGVFEFDSRAAELRKTGVKLKLQDQPCQVLLKLLEHRGEIVSQQELRSTLWRGDTFVDFETGLNTAVKRLRETLGDSADNPAFIQTLPRREYRFIAPVAIPVIQDTQSRVTAEERTSPRRKVAWQRAILAGEVAMFVLAWTALWYSRPRVPGVTNTVRITNDSKAKLPLNPPVTDGVHLYFVEGAPWTTGSRIAQTSAIGGETTRIMTTLPQVLAIYATSLNRSELLVGNGVAASTDLATVRPEVAAELWVQPLPAGAPYRVANIFASAAAWTPDGLHILYAEGHAMMVANNDGSKPRQLANVPARFDSSSTWEMDANGRNVHRLFCGMEGVAIAVLRELVAEQRLLLFSGRLRQRSGDLGDAGAPFPVWQIRHKPFAPDFRTAAFQFSACLKPQGHSASRGHVRRVD